MEPNSKIHIVSHRGLVASPLMRNQETNGHSILLTHVISMNFE
jgi:hypothetical protein